MTHEDYPDIYHGMYSRTIFGFWLYLMSDFILFGALFATYIVLKNSTFGGPSADDLFNLPYTFAQTLVLLLGSLTVGLGGASAHRKNKNWTLFHFTMTFVLGAIFLGMQLNEFSSYIAAGHSWKKSAFLSGYFTLISTHTLHVIFGLIWIPILLLPVWKEGVSHVSIRRLTCLRAFWQFLNIVWLFIFSFVYLLGVKTL
jgi:cytochrome o ubiquinol oxidase subunit III